ncbi:putative uridine kinase C227.14 isoform X1 [Iris pallida]|uniref:Uridine kinase C227.14 isoform X1 n=1 Tax=Iris pallida TaxID=29817 RepID=A0AAX6HCV3_IRIPA|nr:putative uridine kinase C227.14 isoform X1 [Iris pallida]
MNLSLPTAKGSRCLRSSSEPFRPRGRQFGSCQWAPKLISSNKKLSLTSLQNNLKVLSCHKQHVPVLEARSIEEIYDALAERLVPAAEKANDLNSKYIVGLAGPPGAGKTTVASEVVHRLNTFLSQKTFTQLDEVATVLPMDGFHLYRSQLDAMENPKEAHARRGAPWTFNPDLLLKCLHAVRSQGTVRAPSFDHGVGDPIEDDVLISIQHRVVIVEGNYLFLEEGAWKEVCEVFDEKWFIDIDINTAMQRVLKRHIATGKEPDVAKWRIEYNDRPNAELIMESKKHADLLIRSVDF